MFSAEFACECNAGHGSFCAASPRHGPGTRPSAPQARARRPLPRPAPASRSYPDAGSRRNRPPVPGKPVVIGGRAHRRHEGPARHDAPAVRSPRRHDRLFAPRATAPRIRRRRESGRRDDPEAARRARESRGTAFEGMNGIGCCSGRCDAGGLPVGQSPFRREPVVDRDGILAEFLLDS
jgi:hypothetical protein